MLILKQEDYNKIVDHAKKGLPNEACGLLGGYVEGDKRVVTDVYLLRNVDESREHFSMDPAEQLAAIKDIGNHTYRSCSESLDCPTPKEHKRHDGRHGIRCGTR